MKAKKWLTTVASLVLAVSLIAGCTTTGDDKAATNTPSPSATTAGTATPAPAKEAVINTYMVGEIPTIDPAMAKSTVSSWPMRHIFEGLYFYDKDGLKPGQAKDVKISSDGLTYTFTLKDGLKWSNGDPVTAQDFEYSWKHTLDPATASEYAYQISDYVQDFKALDDKTLEVKLKAVTPYFLQLTAFYTYFPVNHKVAAANPKWANEASTFVGNGPFKLTEWTKDKRMVAEKSDTYYAKDTITTSKIVWNNIADDNTAWQMYQNGELNFVKAVPPAGLDQAKASGDLKITPNLATYFYRFNVTKPPFNNVNIRKAFAMAIDRQAIIDNITRAGQKPAFAFVSPGIDDADKNDFRSVVPTFFKEDAAEAKALLAQGMKELNLTALPKITLTYNTNAGHQKIAEAIQEMWKKNLGVEVTIENVESGVWLSRMSALDYQIMRAGWVGDYLDPMTFMDMFVTNGGNNNTGWSNAKYDELIKAAKSEMDPKKRDQEFRDAEKILMEELPIMPIYFYTNADAYKPELSGYYNNAIEYPTFRYVTTK